VSGERAAERDMLVGVLDAMRKLAADSSTPPEIRARLTAFANSLDRVLLVSAWEQPPSLREWRRMVLERHSHAGCSHEAEAKLGGSA